jgi:hypothetical protein
MQFLTYDTTTGSITSIVNGVEEDKEFYINPTTATVNCVGTPSEIIKDSYVLSGVVTLRPIQETTLDKLTVSADGIDYISIINSPTGVFTAINNTGDIISGEIAGSDTFSTTIAGTYKIIITSFPYLDFESTVEAI